jgi:hypothetical protein
VPAVPRHEDRFDPDQSGPIFEQDGFPDLLLLRRKIEPLDLERELSEPRRVEALAVRVIWSA